MPSVSQPSAFAAFAAGSSEQPPSSCSQSGAANRCGSANPPPADQDSGVSTSTLSVFRGSRASRQRGRRRVGLPSYRMQQESADGSSPEAADEQRTSGENGRRKAASVSNKQRPAEGGLRESDRESTCDTGSGDGTALKQGQCNAATHKLSARQTQKVRVRAVQKAKESNQKQLERAVADLLKALPEGAVSAEVLQNTPRRVADAVVYFTKGYSDSVKAAVGNAIYNSYSSRDLIVVSDLDVSSVCEHHLLPFSGKCHIVYLPGRHILGISKFPRIIEVFGRRLQMQERLTAQIADALMEALEPRGVLVMMECTHSCISARGVGQHSAKTKTFVSRGEFARDSALRNDALALIR